MISFLSPWILAALVLLPAIWLLLRVTPPAPRLIKFPAARLLADLKPENQTTSKTPWWILLLRMMVVALIIIALAGPLLNPQESLSGKGPVRIVVDNGWMAGHNWPQQIEKALIVTKKIGRDSREIYILTTAPIPGKTHPLYEGPLSAAQAETILRGLSPHPWNADYKMAAELVNNDEKKAALSLFFAHGAENGYIKPLIDALTNKGEIQLYTPGNKRRPALLQLSKTSGQDLHVKISSLAKDVVFTIQALSSNGQILDSQELDTTQTAEATFSLPATIRQKVGQIRIAGQKSAGSVILLDDQHKRHNVGIITTLQEDNDTPFIDDSYYLERALHPFSDIVRGNPAELIEENVSAMILPDTSSMNPDDLEALESWIDDGGLLLRFAGPKMTQSGIVGAQAHNFLTPVPLRYGDRTLDGALTWDNPVNLEEFAEESPYYGLSITDDITVKRQVLAEPITGLNKMIWAQMVDGTPLITASEEGKGLLVFVHTTATPEWSDMALSGLFVQILRRTINMAGQDASRQNTALSLQPFLALDGFGNLKQPAPTVRPLNVKSAEKPDISSSTPPGLYGRKGQQFALNIGDTLAGNPLPLKALPTFPTGTKMLSYNETSETSLMPWLVLMAFGLFMLDWLIMMVLQSGFLQRGAIVTITLAISIIGAANTNSAIANANSNDTSLAGQIHLAYVRTGNSIIDSTSQQGLKALSKTLRARTSVEPAAVKGVNPEQDELAFFPVLYWPITANQSALSSKALANIQSYLDHGGTILFDTRDQSSKQNAEALKKLAGSLNIPPLAPMPEDHVLKKSFYLLKSMPGAYDGGIIWVTENDSESRDGVSPVIIGSHDWASAWNGSSTAHITPRQQELSHRFGVNFVMYALTGNYKADQVHLPHILERLGK